MSDCLTDEQLELLASQASSEADTVFLDEHLQHCAECRDLLAECRENMSFACSVKGAIHQAADGHSIIQEYLDDPRTTYLADAIPGYQLRHELHHGTQGVVYQALQTATQRQVAIKFLREGVHASRATRKRFEREIELVAGLHHPNIIRVFESGVSSTGHHYYVMDYVHGLPLNRYVWHKQMSLEQALAVFTQVCDAVNFAHQHGIIHRDLKPSNVLIDAAGVPHVLDFGLAKPLICDQGTWASMTGEVVGTLPFMSPEQARGDRTEVDIRTDVYSLGVILYQMLTGEYPYPVVGPIAEVLNHIAETEPVPPRRCWPADEGGIRKSERIRKRSGPCPIDEEVETIILRALAKDPARRYPNVESLNQDIRRYLQGQPIEAKRDAGLHVLRKSLVRYRVAAVATAAAVILSTVFAVVIYNMYLTQFHLSERIDAERIRNIKMQGQLASALLEFGDRALERADFAEARAQYQAALMWNQHMTAGSLDSIASRARLAENYLRLGEAAMCQREYVKASDYFLQSNKLMSGLSETSPNHRGFKDRLAWSEEGLANTLIPLGQLEQARPHAIKAIELRRNLAEEPLADYSQLSAYARLLLNCGVESLRDSRRALTVALEAVSREGGQEPSALGTLALAYWQTGDAAKARETQRRALALVPVGQARTRQSLEQMFDRRWPATAPTSAPAVLPATRQNGS